MTSTPSSPNRAPWGRGSTDPEGLAPLPGDTSCSVVVVGAGITGLTAAVVTGECPAWAEPSRTSSRATNRAEWPGASVPTT